MPPSGYDLKQVASVEAFLRSCFRALQREAVAKGATLLEALRGESRDIAEYLRDPTLDDTARAVLELTKVFYDSLAQVAVDLDSDEALETTLLRVRRSVLGIHVPQP